MCVPARSPRIRCHPHRRVCFLWLLPCKKGRVRNIEFRKKHREEEPFWPARTMPWTWLFLKCTLLPSLVPPGWFFQFLPCFLIMVSMASFRSYTEASTGCPRFLLCRSRNIMFLPSCWEPRKPSCMSSPIMSASARELGKAFEALDAIVT